MSNYDANTALIVVDLQNDFADPGGSLYVREGETIIPFVNREIGRAQAAGALVVYTQDWHPAATPHFAKDGGIWPVHCVAETRGAAFHPALLCAAPARSVSARAAAAKTATRRSRCAVRFPARLPPPNWKRFSASARLRGWWW